MNRQQINRFIRAIEFLPDAENEKWDYSKLVMDYFPQYYNPETNYTSAYVIQRFREFLYTVLQNIEFKEDGK